MHVAARTEELAQRVAEDRGVEVMHVEYLPKGSPPILRLYIDKPGGVSLDDCEKVSKRVAVLLEVEDFIGHNYVLEVTSPGIERPLFKAEDYKRFMGEEIRLAATEKIGDRKNFKGRIADFADGILTLDCQETRYRIPFEKIKKANLIYTF